MASEVRREPVLGNFRPSKSQREKAKRARDPRADHKLENSAAAGGKKY